MAFHVKRNAFLFFRISLLQQTCGKEMRAMPRNRIALHEKA